MIIAILEDSKGFRRSMEIARFKPKIIIPIPTKKHIIDYLTSEEPLFKKLKFNFYKWLEEGKVALYYEEA